MMNPTYNAVSLETPGQFTSEIEQFCSLLARIYARCLQERDPQVLARLGVSTETTKEATHAAA
jgi:hypothetical protein